MQSEAPAMPASQGVRDRGANCFKLVPGPQKYRLASWSVESKESPKGHDFTYSEGPGGLISYTRSSKRSDGKKGPNIKKGP